MRWINFLKHKLPSKDQGRGDCRSTDQGIYNVDANRKLTAWKPFKNVEENYMGNTKAENYKKTTFYKTNKCLDATFC